MFAGLSWRSKPVTPSELPFLAWSQPVQLSPGLGSDRRPQEFGGVGPLSSGADVRARAGPEEPTGRWSHTKRIKY